MQFGLGKQQSTERRVGSQFALWQTLRHNQHAFSEAGVGPHIIRNSRSLSLFSVAIWRIRFAEGQLANTAKLAKNATKTYLAGSCRRSQASTTNCWGCRCLCWWCCCWVNVDIDVDVDFGHETPTQMQRQLQTGTGTGNRNAVRELWPHKIRQSMSQNGQIAELLLLLPQLQCGTN